MMRTICKEIDDYIRQVRSGKYAVCKYQKILCDYVEKAFRAEKLHVDEEQLRRYLAKEQYFPFRLFPWERFLFALHNCTYTKDGRLRWPVIFVLIGRGGGKNGYVSFETFSWLTPVNGVRNYNVDIFANSEDQARTSFDDVRDVLNRNRVKFQKYFYWNMEYIKNLSTGSVLKFRTSGAKTKDGGRPGAIVFDEYHQYEDDKLINVATTGLGKKPMPRQTIITTDGDVRGGPLDDLKTEADDILLRGIADNGMLPFICKLDDEKEVDDEAMWYKANPSLQYFPELLTEMRREYAKYKINPSGSSSFIVKRMNIPKTFDAQSVSDWENIKACSRPLPDPDILRGCDCVAGIDYAKTTDFVVAGLLFKYEGVYYWKQHTWICKQSLDLPRIKAPLQDWADAGYIDFIDGPEIPPALPAAWLGKQAESYNITYLGIDNFRITLMSEALAAEGFDTDKHGRNNIRLVKRVTQNRYVPFISSLFNTGRIGWGDDPMMAWYTWNTAVETTRDGNQFYSKKDPIKRKTDGFSAMSAAICASEDLADAAEETSLSELEFFSF
jgi:phage terminase large subunit-like protein